MPCPRDDQFGFMVRFSRPTRSPSVESARGAPRSAPATSGRRPRRCSQRRRSTTMCAVRPRERISSSLLTPRRRWTARRVRDAESRACFPDSNDASTTGAVFLRGAILRVLSMHARFEGPNSIFFAAFCGGTQESVRISPNGLRFCEFCSPQLLYAPAIELKHSYS
jgi:hypothetical protein